ncbi:MAG: response regulator [Pseudomonadota bacterium]
MADTFLTPNEVAEMFGVSPVTVRQWSQKGLLLAETTAGGHRRYTPAALNAFAQARGMRIPFPQADRLLIVDDEAQVRGYLKALFQAEIPELEIAIAEDGFEAGRLVQSFAPSVVLLDIMMPGLNGIEVCQRLKNDPDTVSIRVIGMTGQFTPEIEVQLLAAGAESLLKKPFSASDVISACGFEVAVTTTVTSDTKTTQILGDGEHAG